MTVAVNHQVVIAMKRNINTIVNRRAIGDQGQDLTLKIRDRNMAITIRRKRREDMEGSISIEENIKKGEGGLQKREGREEMTESMRGNMFTIIIIRTTIEVESKGKKGEMKEEMIEREKEGRKIPIKEDGKVLHQIVATFHLRSRTEMREGLMKRRSKEGMIKTRIRSMENSLIHSKIH